MIIAYGLIAAWCGFVVGWLLFVLDVTGKDVGL